MSAVNHYNKDRLFSYSSHHPTDASAEEACLQAHKKGRLAVLASKDPNGHKPKKGTPMKTRSPSCTTEPIS